MPGAGDLRERIVFSERGIDTNGDAGLGPWEPRFTVSAQMIYLRGGEPVMAQRLQGVQPVAFAIRDSSQARKITTAWRATHVRTGQDFNITSVAPSSKDRGFIDILAQADGKNPS